MTTVRVHVTAPTTTRDREAARDDAVEAIARAGAEGASLVVLPEYASAFDPRGAHAEDAEPLDGPFVAALRDAARTAGCAVVAGMLETDPAGGRPWNTVVLVDGGGALTGSYRKVHLYDAFGQRESDVLGAGDPDADVPLLPVDGLTVGVMTCYDLRFPESARRLVDAGADVVVVPAAWAAGEHKADHWETLLRARAIESTAWVVAAAQQGRGVTGRSMVVDPLGRVVAAGEGPEAVVADLTPGLVAEVRATNPSLQNRRYRVVPG